MPYLMTEDGWTQRPGERQNMLPMVSYAQSGHISLSSFVTQQCEKFLLTDGLMSVIVLQKSSFHSVLQQCK